MNYYYSSEHFSLQASMISYTLGLSHYTRHQNASSQEISFSSYVDDGAYGICFRKATKLHSTFGRSVVSNALWP